MHKVIAIDGYSASGKGSVADKLASILGYLRVDSGKLYRSVAYLAIKNNSNFESDQELINIAKNMDVHYTKDGIFVNEENVTDKLKTKEIDERVIRVCEIYEIRHIVNAHIRAIRNEEDIIIDGRDTTTAVFPDADLKVYLTASFEERVRRRYEEYKSIGKDVTLEDVIENIKYRDNSDDTRAEGRLYIADDAVVIDSTNMNIDEVVDIILKNLESVRSNEFKRLIY
jgi:cytidylate kinase